MMTIEYFVSHVLYHCTSFGGQPRTKAVIIYLQVKLVPRSVLIPY